MKAKFNPKDEKWTVTLGVDGVEAKTEEEAIQKAIALVNEGHGMFYSHIMSVCIICNSEYPKVIVPMATINGDIYDQGVVCEACYNKHKDECGEGFE